MQIWFFDFERAPKICTKISGDDEYSSTKIKLDVRTCEIGNMEQTLGSFSDVTFFHFLRGEIIVVESPVFSHFTPQRMHQTKLVRGKKKEQGQTLFKDLRQGNLKLYLNFLKLNWRKKHFFLKSHGSHPKKKYD